MSTEAMKLARDALGLYARTLAPTETQKKGMEAITALDEALAQPQQEPVAKIEITRCKFTGELESWTFAERPRNAPAGTYYVYTTPQPAQRQPLTDEEVETVWRSVQASDFHDCVKPFARAIEAKHGIKEST